jgi:hypothetical protein
MYSPLEIMRVGTAPPLKGLGFRLEHSLRVVRRNDTLELALSIHGGRKKDKLAILFAIFGKAYNDERLLAERTLHSGAMLQRSYGEIVGRSDCLGDTVYETRSRQDRYAWRGRLSGTRKIPSLRGGGGHLRTLEYTTSPTVRAFRRCPPETRRSCRPSRRCATSEKFRQIEKHRPLAYGGCAAVIRVIR